MAETPMRFFHSWSGGKDSTAGVILDHIHGLPPSTIVFSEVMFDKKRGISGELPEHIDFVKNKAKPLFESWGYTVEILHAEKDYLDLFYHVRERSKYPERIGKRVGFVQGGRCAANSELKIKPIHDFYKRLDIAGSEYMQYIGIAIDEPERLKRLRGTNKVSLLERYSVTEAAAFDLCKQYDLLSPTYDFLKRGGCWFCPNQGYGEFARLKTQHPELWEELRTLSKAENLVSDRFKYSQTFEEVEKRVDDKIRGWAYAAQQQSLFDLI